MIEKKVNSIKVKDYNKFESPELNFENQHPVIKFEIRGDGIGSDECKENRASKVSLEDYRLWLKEQERLCGLLLNNYDSINDKNEIYFGRTKYIVL